MSKFCKYVSQKVRKIRWQPTPKDNLQPSDVFIAGSWDDEVNKLCAWSYGQAANNLQNSSNYLEPKLLTEISHVGDVTELQFLNPETFVASSSTGSISLYRFQKHQALKCHQKWEKLHHFRNSSRMCPCTSLTVRNEDIVTVGEDGRICHLNAKRPQPITVIDDAESCTINAVMYLKQHEVFTANVRGQLKVWDLRSNTKEPAQKFCLSGDQVSLQCLAQHPGQNQVVATGGQDGTLYIWDMRQDKYPITLLTAHSASIQEVKFHPHCPNHLFTCSEDGAVWHWDCSAISRTSATPVLMPNKARREVSESIPWLSCDASKHRLEICSLLPANHLPVNSIDIEDKTLLCGVDSEAIYILPNLIIAL